MVKNERSFYLTTMAVVAAVLVFTVSRALAVDTPAGFDQTKAVSACEIGAQWNKVPAATGYTLQTASNNTFTQNVASYSVGTGDPRLNTVYYNMGGLAPNTSLYLHVSASASGQNSLWSSPVSATTFGTPATFVPGITAAAGQYGNQQIRIDFSASSSPSQYGGWGIQYATDNGSGFGGWQDIQGQVTPYNQNFYIDNGNNHFLNPALAYKYQVREYNSDLGCSTNWYSAYSSPIIVPSLPANLAAQPYFDINRNPQNYVTLSWATSTDANYYEISRDPGSGFQVIGTILGTTYTDNGVSANANYTYRVRAYNNSNGGVKGYSDYSAAIQIRTHGSPTNFTAALSKVYQDSAGNSQAVINFSWNNDYAPNSDYYVYEAPGLNATTGFTQTVGAAHAPLSTKVITASLTVPAGPGYTFCVAAMFGTAVGPCSAPLNVNTNVIPLYGYAWAGERANGDTNGPAGLGWIKFSPSDTPADSVPYGVFEDPSTGQLSGYAWTSWNGWLSFNDSDASHSVAKIQNGQLTGWAKFVGASSTQSAWSGWVSLNGNINNNNGHYGVCQGRQAYVYPDEPLCYGSATASNQLNGWSWGGDDVGWISWSGSIAGGGSYAVTLGSSSIANPGQPQNVSATKGPCPSPNNCSINVQWTNPVPYKRVQVQISTPNQKNMSDKSQYRVAPGQDFQDTAHIKQTAGSQFVTTTINNLPENTTFGVFIRGCANTSCK